MLGALSASGEGERSMRWSKRWMAGAVLVVAVVAAAAHTFASTSSDDPDALVADEFELSPDEEAIRELRLSGPLLARAVDPEAPRADGGLFEIAPDGSAEKVSDMRCKRVAVAPTGEGICLGIGPNGIDYQATLFERGYRKMASFPVKGVPDRARVSPDGRHAAYTSFDSNGAEGYFESADDFTTYTRIIDVRSGEEVLDLEDLHFVDDGRRLRPTGTELWGVTFAGGSRFYATLASGPVYDRMYHLIAGRIGSHQAELVASGVECPAISPDGKWIAYKRRKPVVYGLPKPIRWRFQVLDIETGRRVRLAEPRSIDDQPEWLGNDTIVYSDDRSLFAVPADGRGKPTRLASTATSATPLSPP
jgi:hypothetical protein